MQEEIDRKIIALSVSSAKMTERVLSAVIREYLRRQQNKQLRPPKGKQTIKQLVESGAALSNIEITDKNIKSFEPVAKKYGLDYALKRTAPKRRPGISYFSRARTPMLSPWRLMSIPKKYSNKRKSLLSASCLSS